MLTLYVEIASGLGACLRLLLMDLFKLSSFFSNLHFPVVTFLINIIGSALLGLLFWYVPSSDLNTILSVGIIGGFTTLSTFNNELLLLWKKHKIICLLYGISTYLFGIIVVIITIK